jgi:hypothetical protein
MQDLVFFKYFDVKFCSVVLISVVLMMCILKTIIYIWYHTQMVTVFFTCRACFGYLPSSGTVWHSKVSCWLYKSLTSQFFKVTPP